MKPFKSQLLAYIEHNDVLRPEIFKPELDLIKTPITELIWRVKEIDETEYWIMAYLMTKTGHKLFTPFDALINRWDESKVKEGWWEVSEPGTIFEAEQAVILSLLPPNQRTTFYHYKQNNEDYWVLANHTQKVGAEVKQDPIRFRPVSKEYIDWVKLRVWGANT